VLASNTVSVFLFMVDAPCRGDMDPPTMVDFNLASVRNEPLDLGYDILYEDRL
jgi:hypothetical protein